MGHDSTRPAVWTNPAGLFNRVVALGGGRIVYGRGEGKSAEELEASASDGRGVKSIALEAIQRVQANRRNHEIRLTHKSGLKKHQVDLELAGEPEQTECFESLQSALGASFNRRHVAMSALRGALRPMFALVIIGLMTWLSYQTVLEVEAGREVEVRGHKAAIKLLFLWLVEALGRNGVLVGGGAVMLIGLLVVIHRIRKPPIYDELVRL